MEKESENSSLGRRKYLSFVGGGVAGSSIINKVGSVTGSPVDVVTEIGGDGTKYYKRIPRDWWEYNKKTDSALRTAKSHLLSHPDIDSIGLTVDRSDGLISGRLKPKLRYSVYNENGSEVVPNSVGGIPAVVEQSEPTELLAYDECPYNTGHYESIGGGTGMYAKKENGKKVFATSCSVMQKNNNRFLLTANHTFQCEPNDLDAAYQGNRVFGYVSSYSSSNDWTLIELNADESWTNAIRVSDAISNPIVWGHFTEAGLEYLFADPNHYVGKQGRSTGYTLGEITSIKNSGLSSSKYPCVDIDNYIETSTEAAKGDSGGPIWSESSNENGDVSVVAMTNSGSVPTSKNTCTTPNNGGFVVHAKTNGIAAYQVFRDSDCYFGTGHLDRGE
ncbi:chymotrypsin family serine protease [Haladaptatus cibarius]|uniref:hypothetical protein n=1 Tax=Haladaptatus cibarius TaxID=453847 RepID=UPI000A772611|nr:hypothetical protein [Haladaptatus cibarius]